jgi:hypothetical protein
MEAQQEIVHLLRRQVRATERIEEMLQNYFTQVTGGTFRQIGTPMLPIQPGNSPKFQVTPTFSGPAFTLDGSKAAITTSDTVNAPAVIDLTDDPTGETFIINLTPDVVIDPNGEKITVDWSYTNLDGVIAHVTGTLTENGIVDDVTGGTFSQID